MEIKIKPIKGCEEMGWFGQPEKRKNALVECAKKIKNRLENKGISVEEILIYAEGGNKRYPQVILRGDDWNLTIKIGNRVTECHFLFYFFLGEVEVTYDEVDMRGYIYGKLWYRPTFLVTDDEMEKLSQPIIDYFVKISKNKEYDIEELIEFLIPQALKINKKIEKIYEETKNKCEKLCKENEKLRNMMATKWAFLHGRWHSESMKWFWILWMNDGVKMCFRI